MFRLNLRPTLAIFAVLLATGVAHAGDSAREDPFTLLLETKYTEIDLHGSGEPDVFRVYDAAGELQSITYLNRMRKEKETLELQPLRRVRTFEQDGIVTKREIELFSLPGVRETREITWSPQGTADHDHRLLDRYLGYEVIREIYARDAKGTWKVQERSRSEGIVTAAGQTDSYVSCLGEGHGGVKDPSGCKAALNSLVTVHTTNFQNYTALVCTKGNDLFLPQGFRIDMQSCGAGPTADAKIGAIKASINSLQAMLECIRGYNPAIGEKLAKAIAEHRPKLNCLGGGLQLASGTEIWDKLCTKIAGTSDGTQCQASIASHTNATTGAFFASKTPDDLYLVVSDPGREINVGMRRNESEVMLDSTIPSDQKQAKIAERNATTLAYYRNMKNNDPLAGITLHELMHLAGIPHDHTKIKCRPTDTVMTERHNCPSLGGAAGFAKQFMGDAVYGCQGLCGGRLDAAGKATKNTGVSTQAGCEKCVKEGNPKGNIGICGSP